jgi:hypothetical protein
MGPFIVISRGCKTYANTENFRNAIKTQVVLLDLYIIYAITHEFDYVTHTNR